MSTGDQSRPAAGAPRWLAPAVGVGATLAMIALVAGPGSGSPFGAFSTVLLLWIEAGGVSVAWMLGAAGIGAGIASRSRLPSSVAIALGVALMLWIAHGLGALGLFAGRAGVVVAWAPVVIGVALLLARLRRTEPGIGAMERLLPLTAVLAVPAIALLAVGACLPPGTVWRSEAHGFDALSYHLQLPREWLALGRIAPLEHNAYSWLPSGMESAFTQLGAMRGGGVDAHVGGQGLGVHSAQMLHALLTVCAALVIGRTALHLIGRAHGDRDAFNLSGAIGAAALSVPWVVVVGSSAYNEGAVLLLFAAALRTALDARIEPGVRGIVCGVLLGAAVSAKPTAFFMAALPVGAVLLATAPVRRWPVIGGCACIGGLFVLAPWLTRNWAAGGNPVFPYLSGVFGSAHWTELEVARWSLGHHERASIPQRVALLFSVERGALHPQWALFPLLVLASVPLALRPRITRPVALALTGAVGVQLVCWLGVGHLQSRFLIPLIVPGTLLVALALESIRAWKPRAALVSGVTIAVALSLASVRVFLEENSGAPNLALIPGVPALTGEALGRAMPALTPEEQRAQLRDAPPAAFINLTLPDTTVYLLGDSTPLYLRVPVVYHTTWDRSPLGDALEANGNDLAGALSELRARGVTHILINLDEFARLTRDRWYDPRVTPEMVHRVVTDGGRPVKAWSGSGPLGTFLIEIGPVGAGGTP